MSSGLPGSSQPPVFHPVPSGNGGSRESSEFEFVAKQQTAPSLPQFNTSPSLLQQTLTEAETGIRFSPQPPLPPSMSVPSTLGPTSHPSPFTGAPSPTMSLQQRPLPPPGMRTTPTSLPLPPPSTSFSSGKPSVSLGSVTPSMMRPSSTTPVDRPKFSSEMMKPDEQISLNQPESLLAQVEPPSAGMFGWVRGSGLLNRVVEKTRSVTTNVITTLDPQMKEYIQSGGDVQLVIASDKEDKVSPLREAFQNVFGQATVIGLPAKSVTIAEQPVGFASGRQAALERISSLRKCGSVEKNTVVVSVENFLYEVSESLWLDISCLILSDPLRQINLQTYSQPTNVSSDQINQLKDATPADYPKQWSGFALPIGGVMANELQVSPQQWQEAVTGVSRKRLLLLAGEALAGMYKRALRAKVDDV